VRARWRYEQVRNQPRRILPDKDRTMPRALFTQARERRGWGMMAGISTSPKDHYCSAGVE